MWKRGREKEKKGEGEKGRVEYVKFTCLVLPRHPPLPPNLSFQVNAAAQKARRPAVRTGGEEKPRFSVALCRALLTTVFSSLNRFAPLALARSSRGQFRWCSDTNSNRLFFLEVKRMREGVGAVLG